MTPPESNTGNKNVSAEDLSALPANEIFQKLSEVYPDFNESGTEILVKFVSHLSMEDNTFNRDALRSEIDHFTYNANRVSDLLYALVHKLRAGNSN